MKETLPWIVWRVDGYPPTVQHPDYGTAKREAQRLARANPGQTFMVCVGVVSFIKTDLVETRFDLEGAPGAVLDEELPF